MSSHEQRHQILGLVTRTWLHLLLHMMGEEVGMLHVRRKLTLLLAHTEMRRRWALLLGETAIHTIARPNTRATKSHQVIMRRETRIQVWVTQISQRKLL